MSPALRQPGKPRQPARAALPAPWLPTADAPRDRPVLLAYRRVDGAVGRAVGTWCDEHGDWSICASCDLTVSDRRVEIYVGGDRVLGWTDMPEVA